MIETKTKEEVRREIGEAMCKVYGAEVFDKSSRLQSQADFFAERTTDLWQRVAQLDALYIKSGVITPEEIRKSRFPSAPSTEQWEDA